MAEMETAIGVMCKPPRIGLSKTRLAAHVGPEMAARLSAAFLQDVGAAIEAAASPARARPYAVYCPADGEGELRRLLPPSFAFMLQHGATLGLSMHLAITELLALGHGGAILVGADLPTLPSQILVEAVEALREPSNGAVIGPSPDGGYYLIGLKAAHGGLFEDIPWSSGGVFGATLDRAEEIGLPVHVLPEWRDVDDGASFAHLRDELAGLAPPPAPGRAPRSGDGDAFSSCRA